MDSYFDLPDFDWSDFDSRSLGFTFDSASFLFPIPPYRSFLPVEIVSEIFLYTFQADPSSRAKLMLVCRQWHDIMLSTPGIHSQLRIHKGTREKDVERFGRMWLLDVTIDMENERYGGSFDPERFFVCFMAAAQAASRWRSFELVALPPPGEYKDLQIVLPLQHLETFKLAPSCSLGNLLEPLMTTITSTVTPCLTVMDVLHPDATPYLVQPTHSQIFSTLTTLRLNWRRVQNPMNIFPYLHKIETFEAHHLLLPISSSHNDIPMIQTLHVLRLKSSSVQWMADQIFPALEECSIIFPHHADAIQSVYMPSCSILKYDSNNLGTLEHFHHPPLAILEVKCGQWQTWSGTLQLFGLHPIFASQSLICLHLQIKCSEKLLVHMLELVPALEELWMGLSSPHALSCAFFLAFAAGERNATASIGTSSRAIRPLCRELKRLHVHYKRWLRGPERKALMPAFGDIVTSHQRLKQTGFSLCLSFDGGSKKQVWNVNGLVEKFDFELEEDETWIGFSSPHGIVYLSTPVRYDHAYPQHFKELEYIAWREYSHFPIDYFLPFHSLKEMRISGSNLELQPNKPLSLNFPLFRTLKVLDVWTIQSSFLAGQKFDKLEGFREEGQDFELDADLLTEMPVCTRLVVGLSRLASLKVPQICELSVFMHSESLFSDQDSSDEDSLDEDSSDEKPEPNRIWEAHVAVNSNLTGLKLLHFYDPYSEKIVYTNLIRILRSLPALETLIIDHGYIKIRYMDFFKAFVPIRAQETSRLHQSCGESQMSGELCPNLESLQIQGISLTEEPELMPVLKDIVTLRTTVGSPLKSFTFYVYHSKNTEQKWELIGKDGRFTMEEVVPAQKFELKI